MKHYSSINIRYSIVLKWCVGFSIILICGCTNQNKKRNSILNDLFNSQKNSSIIYRSELKAKDRLMDIQKQINMPSQMIYSGLIKIPDLINQDLIIPSYLINIQNDNTMPIRYCGNYIIVLINKAGRILLNAQPTPIKSFEKELFSQYTSGNFNGDNIYISLKIQDGIENRIRKQILQLIVRSMESYYEKSSKRIYNLSIRELSEIQKQDFLSRTNPIIWYENFLSPRKPLRP